MTTEARHPRRAAGAGDPLARPEGRLPTRVVVLGLAVGVLLGGVIGASIGAGRARTYQATTVATVLPDDALSQVNGTAAASATNDYVQGELIVLTGREVRAAVQQRLGLDALPTVSASQSGTTDLVDVTGSASTEAGAVAVANAARDAYAVRRQQQITRDVATAQAQVRQQITALRASIADSPQAATDAGSALQQEYARLLAVDSQLTLDAAQADQAVTTIQTAVVAGGGLSPAETGGLGGAVVGALLSALALVALRRARPMVRGLDDLAGCGADVLTPTFPRDDAGRARAARLLGSRLRGLSPGPVAVVLSGVSAEVDTAPVTAALARTYARNVPVLVLSGVRGAGPLLALLPATAARITPADVGLLRASRTSLAALAEADGGNPIRVLDAPDAYLRRADETRLLDAAAREGWYVVADLPAPDESDLAPLLGVLAGGVTLVATQGLSRPDDVAAAVEAVLGYGVPAATLLLAAAPSRMPRRPGPPTPPVVAERVPERSAVTAVPRVAMPVHAVQVDPPPPPPGRPAPQGPRSAGERSPLHALRPNRS